MYLELNTPTTENDHLPAELPLSFPSGAAALPLIVFVFLQRPTCCNLLEGVVSLHNVYIYGRMRKFETPGSPTTASTSRGNKLVEPRETPEYSSDWNKKTGFIPSM